MFFSIGIGGSLAAPPLPHHRAYGSVHGGSMNLCGQAGRKRSEPELGPQGVRGRHAPRALRSLQHRRPGLHPSPPAPRPVPIWIFCRIVRMSVSSYLSCPSFGPSPVARLLCPLLTSAPRSRPLRYRSVRTFRTRRRPPEVRPTAFIAYPPHLPPRPLMAVDFAIIGSLVPPGRPHIRFLSIGSRLCYTLPSDTASRRRPCASLILRRQQAG